MTADEVKKILGLVPHPREGGCYIRTYQSGEMLPAAAFADGRYTGPRHTATAIYYLLEPGAFSEMHCLKSDEVFHFLRGRCGRDAAVASGRKRDHCSHRQSSGRGRTSAGGRSARRLAGIAPGRRRRMGAAGMHGQSGLRVCRLPDGHAGRTLREVAQVRAATSLAHPPHTFGLSRLPVLQSTSPRDPRPGDWAAVACVCLCRLTQKSYVTKGMRARRRLIFSWLTPIGESKPASPKRVK